ncbi:MULTISPECIES: phenylalanine--tRNA ligase beta subunit-related protein [unclassified Dysgonomonas]|uniref:B3/B4 domain-containing protein n=1 Tax=unclassified Dysgonomonas TaxID=2630389 RepID=UPI0024749505|nr:MULTISPECIES: phenylalanine--tRNA ligase beta subunit-related protein [unclassified Dysgonomonas]
MLNVIVSDEIKKACPEFSGAAILAKVKNSLYNEGLWKQIDALVKEYKAGHAIEDIKNNRAIAATRTAYKRLGKDPNRYRPSSEALCRRIVRGLPLYQIDTLVDMINLVSIRTGYSIGGFDVDKIEGDTLTLGVGMADEPYDAIGRGILNIEGLPVYRDDSGGIGTPTSDHERTKIGIETTNFLAIINGYSGKDGLLEAVEYMQNLLREYADSDGGQIIYFQ